jgi:hypothetical protein
MCDRTCQYQIQSAAPTLTCGNKCTYNAQGAFVCSSDSDSHANGKCGVSTTQVTQMVPVERFDPNDKSTSKHK